VSFCFDFSGKQWWKASGGRSAKLRMGGRGKHSTLQRSVQGVARSAGVGPVSLDKLCVGVRCRRHHLAAAVGAGRPWGKGRSCRPAVTVMGGFIFLSARGMRENADFVVEDSSGKGEI